MPTLTEAVDQGIVCCKDAAQLLDEAAYLIRKAQMLMQVSDETLSDCLDGEALDQANVTILRGAGQIVRNAFHRCDAVLEDLAAAAKWDQAPAPAAGEPPTAKEEKGPVLLRAS